MKEGQTQRHELQERRRTPENEPTPIGGATRRAIRFRSAMAPLSRHIIKAACPRSSVIRCGPQNIRVPFPETGLDNQFTASLK
jgi:hypothetical protein